MRVTMRKNLGGRNMTVRVDSFKCPSGLYADASMYVALFSSLQSTSTTTICVPLNAPRRAGVEVNTVSELSAARTLVSIAKDIPFDAEGIS